MGFPVERAPRCQRQCAIEGMAMRSTYTGFRGESAMLWRVWGVRHLRFFWHAWRVNRWARMWGDIGIGTGVPNASDIEHLRGIWRGER
jgi:hypothetical protein